VHQYNSAGYIEAFIFYFFVVEQSLDLYSLKIRNSFLNNNSKEPLRSVDYMLIFIYYCNEFDKEGL